MPAPTTLCEIFTDWDGFEQFVARLHRTGSVTVEHNVTLTGRSGASRQIDVLVRHKEGLYEHLIVVECKYRKSSAATPISGLSLTDFGRAASGAKFAKTDVELVSH